MSYETYVTQRHTVLSVVPDYSTKRIPVGFIVIVPGTNRSKEVLDTHMSYLQSKVYIFPDELTQDIIRGDQNPEIAHELSDALNVGINPGVINFVYFPSIRRSEGKPIITFDAGVVATRGYHGITLPSNFSMLHRKGKPVVGVGSLDESGSRVVFDERTLIDLQTIILREFAQSLSTATRPHFVPSGIDYTHVVVNPLDAYIPSA